MYLLDYFRIYFFAVVAQFYETRVIDEFVLRGNSVIMKCNLPSFVADFVYVEAWISTDDSDIEEYYPNNTKWGTVHRKLVVTLTLRTTHSSHPIRGCQSN